MQGVAIHENENNLLTVLVGSSPCLHYFGLCFPDNNMSGKLLS